MGDGPPLAVDAGLHIGRLHPLALGNILAQGDVGDPAGGENGRF